MPNDEQSSIDFYRQEVMPEIIFKQASVLQPETLEDRLLAAWLILNKKSATIDLSGFTYGWYASPQQLQSFPGINTPDETSISNILTFSSRFVLDRIAQRRDIHVVDWGCGNGYKGISLFNLLKARYLHLIDNKFALALAKDNCAEQDVRHVGQEARLEGAYLDQDAPYRFHVILGNTISNFGREKKLQQVVTNISDQMRIGEYLFVEWTTFGSERYSGSDGMNFMYPYLLGLIPNCPRPTLEAEAEQSKEETKLTYGAKLEGQPHTSEIRCKFTVRKGFLTEIRDREYAFKKGTVFIPSTIQRFSIDAITKVMEASGLEQVCLWKKEGVKLDEDELGLPNLRGYGQIPQYEHREGDYHYALFEKRQKQHPMTLPQISAAAALLCLGFATGIPVGMNFRGNEKQEHHASTQKEITYECQDVSINFNATRNSPGYLLQCKATDGTVHSIPAFERIMRSRIRREANGRAMIPFSIGDQRYILHFPEWQVARLDNIDRMP